MTKLLQQKRIGFIGAGNMTQTITRGLVEGKVVPADNVFVSNRTPGKLLKLEELYKIQISPSNEQLVEDCDVIVLATKPQDLLGALEGIASSFYEGQIVISIAAGIKVETLEKHLPQCRIVRVVPNTPSVIGKGVVGYFCEEDPGLEALIEGLFGSLGEVLHCETEDQLDALLVGCSSGTGFVYELMMYFQDWLTEHGFDSEIAEKMTIDTFLGAAQLAAQSRETIEELQSKVTSKKGVTAAGLQSMRELEIERALRISLEKAALRNKELSKGIK